MTDKLREARIAEAKRRAEANVRNVRYDEGLANHLIDIIEQDWRPEPEVDAVEAAFKVWADAIPNGESVTVPDAFRAGHAEALATCADVRRMDWLGERWVSVEEAPGKYLDHKVPLDVAPDLRTKIDRAMEQPS